MDKKNPWKILFVIFFLTCSLSACTKTPLNQPPLGPISATGTLISADVSLLRRGTHLLLVNGKKMYYVESKTEDLVNKVGQTVHIEGIAEANTSPDDLPVLVATKLTSVQGESGLHVWNIPALDIQMQTPNAWTATIKNSVASFALPGEEKPLLVIRISGSGSLPAEGTHYYLSGRRAVRTNPKEGTIEDVYVLNGETVLFFHFDASTQQSVERMEDAKLLENEFEYALNSIKFLSDRASNSANSGSMIFAPCGGEANVLCPHGSFCDIADPVAKIGKCRPLKS